MLKRKILLIIKKIIIKKTILELSKDAKLQTIAKEASAKLKGGIVIIETVN